MIQYLGPRSKPNSKLPPLFTTNGTEGVDYLYSEETASDGTVNWELAILKDCNFIFHRLPKVQLFLVGGGFSGESGSYDGDMVDTQSYRNARGGSGGDGGLVLTVLDALKLALNTLYSVTIGQGGTTTKAPTATTGFGRSSENGNSVAIGGDGGWVSTAGRQRSSGAGKPGVYAFGKSTSLIQSLSGIRYGASAGGGAAYHKTVNTVSDGDHTGGDTGAGTGATKATIPVVNATAGASNTGSGGGGGWGRSDIQAGLGAAGGSGILIMRNWRSAA